MRPVTRRELFAGLAGVITGGALVDQLMPETAASTLADIDRRLRALEGAQRVGLSRIVQVYSGLITATGPGDIGVPLSGPSVDVVLGTSALIMIHGDVENIGTTAAHHASSATVAGEVTPSPLTGVGSASLGTAGVVLTPEITQNGNFHRFTTPFLPGEYSITPTIWFTTNVAASSPTILPAGWCQVIIVPLD